VNDSIPEGFLSYDWLNRARPQCILAKDDIAVQVVSARIRRPLETDERGELARLIGLVRRFVRFLPRSAIGVRTGQRHQARGYFFLGE